MNVGRKPLFVIDQDCQVVASRISQKVEEAGMRTLRSFDLDGIRSSNKGFCCPIHGRSNCTCQIIILLILLRDRRPLTLIMEGLDQKTWIYLDSGGEVTEERVDPILTRILLLAFAEKSNG